MGNPHKNKWLFRVTALILSSNIHVISNILEKLLNFLAKYQAQLKKMELLMKKKCVLAFLAHVLPVLMCTYKTNLHRGEGKGEGHTLHLYVHGRSSPYLKKYT